MSDERVPVDPETESEPAAKIGTDAVDPDELLSRLQVIEAQPLADRAAAFTQVHDELRAALEAGDAHV